MMENHSFKVDKTRVDAGLVSAYNVQIPARIEGYTPLDPSYALHTTPINKRFRTFPSMVVYPKTAEEVADIIKAVHTATSSTSASDQSPNESPIRIVVRSGGHNYAAFSSGFEETSEAQEKDAGRADGMGKDVHPVIVIDLKHFDTIEYDEQSQIATIGSGTRLGKVSEELYKRGRALPHGVCPNVGIGGHVLHGGHGFTSRAWGLAMDRIVEMQVVLADGSIVTASNNDDKHKDLFWAMRGAGPSFGVALSFKLLTLSAPPTNVYFLYEWDAVKTSDATNAFLEYQKWLPDVPAELSTGFMFCRGEKKGYVHVWFSGQYLGPIGPFHATVAPFFSQLEPYLDFSHIKQGQKLNPKHAGQDPSFKVEECTFERALFYLGDGTGDSDTFYATSLSVPEGGELTEGQVRALLAHLLESSESSRANGKEEEIHWFAMADNWGGKYSQINAVPYDATACIARSNLYAWQFYVRSLDRLPPLPQNAVQFCQKMREVLINSRTGEDADQWAYAGIANYVDVEMSRQEAHRMYYGNKVPRLREIKRKYDPKNVFRYKHSILPAD